MKTFYIISFLISFPVITYGQKRSGKNATISSSQISEKHLGLTIEKAIRKYKVDTAKCSLQSEPPGISRGLQVELTDSVIVYLQIERKPNFDNHFSTILNEPVKGIGLAFPNCTKKKFGTNFVWWGLRNPYCKKEE